MTCGNIHQYPCGSRLNGFQPNCKNCPNILVCRIAKPTNKIKKGDENE
jgi:hypothetical protein